MFLTLHSYQSPWWLGALSLYAYGNWSDFFNFILFDCVVLIWYLSYTHIV